MLIDNEFKSLIPPLTQDEYKQLEENILKEGCRDALVIWSDTLVDGHNRFEICVKHTLEYKTTEKQFADRQEAIEWIIRNQFGRRNLTAYDRSKLALRLTSVIVDKAKENQKLSDGRGQKGSPKSANLKTTDTRKELAKLAGVSHDTIDKVRIIEKEATPEQKESLSSGEKKINTVYKELRPPKETPTPEPPKKKPAKSKQPDAYNLQGELITMEMAQKAFDEIRDHSRVPTKHDLTAIENELTTILNKFLTDINPHTYHQYEESENKTFMTSLLQESVTELNKIIKMME